MTTGSRAEKQQMDKKQRPEQTNKLVKVLYSVLVGEGPKEAGSHNKQVCEQIHSPQEPFTASPCHLQVPVHATSPQAPRIAADIRSPAPLHKLSGQLDVVSAVAFHPSRIMLSTGTLSSEIKYFVNPRTS
ncbi:hypothetical protein EMCRGX_G032724 [Ephydatia muelleri]